MKNLYISFSESLEKIEKPYNKIIFLCIGTDRSTGDSYGPIVGSMLKERLSNENIEIYGTIHEPVHAMNLSRKLKNIDCKNNLVIAVDAMVGDLHQVGKIYIENKSIKPGSGMNKNLGEVGDIGIKGIVNISGLNGDISFHILQNTRLSVVYDLAKLTASTIINVLKNKPHELVACTK